MRQSQGRMWIAVAWLAAWSLGCSHTAPADWRTISVNGKCSIQMPGDPKKLEERVDTPTGEVQVTTYILRLDNNTKAYYATTMELPAGLPEPQGEMIDHRLQSIEDGAVGRTKGKLLSSRKISHDGYAGRQFILQLPNGSIGQCHVFLVHRTVCQVQILGGNPQEIERFFASFRLTSDVQPPANS